MQTKTKFLLLSLFMQLLLTINNYSQITEKCGTFSPEVLTKGGMVCSRPSFYPSNLTEQTIETTHFIVHFVTDDNTFPLMILDPPSDAITWQYAQKVSQAAEASWNFQINSLGWQAPPGDGDCGGGYNKYDIYIKYLNYYGATWSETQAYGNGYTSYIIITNGITIAGQNTRRPMNEDEIKITVAHEFNHAIQMGYNFTKPSSFDAWFYENTATWIEEIQYPEINDWISTFLNENEINPLNNTHLNIDNDYFYYSGALFCHMLSRWFDNDIIKNIWVYSATSSNSFLNDINSVLVNKGKDLKSALKRYSIWRYFTGLRDDGNHFPKGHLYPTAKILRTHNNGTGNNNSFQDHLYSRGGTSYIEFKNADGVINISFDGYDNTEFSTIAFNRRVYFPDVENNFILDSENKGIVSNISCIGEDYVILVPTIIEWQNPQSNLNYKYTSSLGAGISTSFWTEKENINILQGTLSVQLSQPISSGTSKNLTNQLKYRVKTNFERFSNYQGKTIKHNNWNSTLNDYLLENDFFARPEFSKQSAKYNFLEPVKVQVLIEGTLISEKGEAYFQDPWYQLNDGSQPGTNYWINFTSEYEPTGKENATEKGVFLDQGAPDWSPPYYSVKADAVQTINLGGTIGTRDFYFQNWSGSNVSYKYPTALETPIAFLSENTISKAIYKGIQLTDVSTAFGNSSQRKLVCTSFPDNYYHLVYSSLGNVWYEKALVNNTVIQPSNWQLMNNGKPLDGHIGITEAKSPSIDYVFASHYHAETNYYIYITYQKKKSDGKYEIRLAKFNQDGLKIFDIEVFSSAHTNYSSFDCMPVIGVSRDKDDYAPIKVVILWKRPTEGSSTAGLYYVAGFDQGTYINWTDSYPNPIKISTTDINSTNPSIAAFKNPNSNIYYHVAYQQSTTQIKYFPINFGVRGSTAGTPVTVSTGSGSPVNISPSITVSNSHYTYPAFEQSYDSPKIVWCTGEHGEGIYRYRTTMQSLNWSPLYIYMLKTMMYKARLSAAQSTVLQDMMNISTLGGVGLLDIINLMW